MDGFSYLEEERASQVFKRLLETITVRRWFCSGPYVKGIDQVLFVSFHVHPDDATHMYDLISVAAKEECAGVFWSFKRVMQNRFFLCPDILSYAYEVPGEFGLLEEEVLKQHPDLGVRAAQSLKLLSKKIYSDFKKSGRSPFDCVERV